jgi:hypothetical protein
MLYHWSPVIAAFIRAHLGEGPWAFTEKGESDDAETQILGPTCDAVE